MSRTNMDNKSNNSQASKKIDRRIQRTRRFLSDALMILILEKGYEAVTIQEVVDRANIGRATFYLHFKDKEELLLKSLEQIMDELAERIDKAKAEGGVFPAELIFQHAGENATFYSVLLGGQGGQLIFRQLRRRIAERAKVHLALVVPAGELDLVANHFAGSLLMMLAWWLENEMPYSAETIADYFRKLIGQGLWGIKLAQEEKIPLDNLPLFGI